MRWCAHDDSGIGSDSRCGEEQSAGIGLHRSLRRWKYAPDHLGCGDRAYDEVSLGI